MDYDFSGLTREQAAKNIDSILEQLELKRRDHALFAASLALLVDTGPPAEPEPSSNGQADRPVGADQLT